MTEIANCDDTVRPASKSFDLETLTRQAEQGNTRLLEASLSCSSSMRDRIDVLMAVQGLNAVHRLQEPDKHLPILSIDLQPTGAGLNVKTQLALNAQEYKPFAVPQPLYVERNWSTLSGAHREIVKRSANR